MEAGPDATVAAAGVAASATQLLLRPRSRTSASALGDGGSATPPPLPRIRIAESVARNVRLSAESLMAVELGESAGATARGSDAADAATARAALVCDSVSGSRRGAWLIAGVRGQCEAAGAAVVVSTASHSAP